jgi:hypothetical protein
VSGDGDDDGDGDERRHQAVVEVEHLLLHKQDSVRTAKDEGDGCWLRVPAEGDGFG